MADRGSWASLVCVALVGFTAMGWNGVLSAQVAGLAPPARVAEVASAASLVSFLGSIGGPLVFTLVVGVTGSFAIGYTLMAAQLALTGALTW